MLPWILVLALLGPPLTPAQQDQHALAMRLADERRDAEAAERFEALLADGVVDRSIHRMAGELRAALNHNAHALRHFQAVLAAADLSAFERKQATWWLEQVTLDTTLVELQVMPRTAATTVVATRKGAAPPPPLTTPVIEGTAAVRLDRGEWLVEVTADGHLPLRRVIDVADGSAPVVLALEPVPPPAPATVPVPPRPVPPLAPPPPDRHARAEVVVGAVLTPLGLLALGGMIGVIPDYQLTASQISGVRHELTTRPCTADDRAELARFIALARQQETALASLGVVGGALVVTGALLLVDGRRRQRSRITVRPGLAGLTLSGTF